MHKNFTKVVIATSIFTLALILIGLVTKNIIVNIAEHKAEKIIFIALKNKTNSSDEEKVIAITQEVFKRFRHNDQTQNIYLRLRPILTNRRLPHLVRLPDGVIETFVQEGYCDNAARMLKFILSQKKYDSIQWDMVFPGRSHSALLVTISDNNKILADPFYGFITINKQNTPIHPEVARKLIENGIKFEDVFRSLGKNSDKFFYTNFENVNMAAHGDTLILETNIPNLNDETLILGAVNGDDLDVKDAATLNKMNPYWHYVGHKYSRSWIRVMTAKEPTTITMVLVDEPDISVLNSIPAPIIDGKNLTWELSSGESLKFTDKDAKFSLKRLNSYIGVDQIIFKKTYQGNH